MVIGAKIRDLRKKLGLTQEQLAGSELTKSYVSQVELGRIHPSEKALRIMARRLGKPLGYFLETNDDLRTIDVLLQAAHALWSTGRMEESVNGLTEALHLAERTGRDDMRAQVHTIMGQLALVRGQSEEAADHLNTAMSLAQQADSASQGAEAACLLGIAQSRLGLSHLAVQAFQRAIDWASGLGEQYAALRAHVVAAYADFWYQNGHWYAAQMLYRQAIADSPAAGDEMLAWIHARLAAALWHTGDEASARQAFDTGVDQMERITNPGQRALVALAAARAAAALDEWARAEAWMEQARDHFAREKNPEAEAYAWEWLLWLAWQTRDADRLRHDQTALQALPDTWPWDRVKRQCHRYAALLAAESDPQSFEPLAAKLTVGEEGAEGRLVDSLWEDFVVSWALSSSDAVTHLWSWLHRTLEPKAAQPLLMQPWRLDKTWEAWSND
jgi:transcriptional regulator with XRE-family HTH domain